MQGKVVLVTGGARRIGAAICRRLHSAGANIALHYRSSRQEALELQADLELLRAGSVFPVEGDLLDPHAVSWVVYETIRHFGRLDALVNNASSFYAAPLEAIDETHWNDLIGTNLKAPLLLAKAAATELRHNHGSIVNIVDIHAERPMRGHLLYSVAKTGLAGLTRALAQELAPHVRVNGVSPGVIAWPEHQDWGDELRRTEIVDHTLLKCEGEPDDIAKTVQFLLNHAPYITGQIVAVDGGRSINL